MKKLELDFSCVKYVGREVFYDAPSPVVIIDFVKEMSWDDDWDKGVKMHGFFSKKVITKTKW